MSSTTRTRAVGGALLALLLGGGAACGQDPGDRAGPGRPPDLRLAWADCATADEGRAAGVQCATADLPLDYDDPDGGQVHIAVSRVPATGPGPRIGSLFVNLGGPGNPAVSAMQAGGAGPLATLNQRFDIVGFDPRGVGQSTPSVDCRVDQETDGPTPRPWPVPADLDGAGVIGHAQAYADACAAASGDLLEHVSTANVARDLDALRAAVGDERLTYLGYSYGAFLGSTYASLFPDRFRALALDGPVPSAQYVEDPVAASTAAGAGVEDALGRFLAACAADQTACSGFGGADPAAALDALLAAAGDTPIPADGYPADPRPVTADDIRDVTGKLLYSKPGWGTLAGALALAAAGDGSIVRAITDEVVFQRSEDGSTDPQSDRYVAITAADQRWPTDPDAYLARGAREWTDVPHFWGRFAYTELTQALWPADDEDAFAGPFTVAADAPTVLVVATTHDPALPYSGAAPFVQELGNARLLTMDGDGHTAYGGNSACIDSAVDAYLVDGTLPAAGTVCAQEVPFTAPEEAPAGTR